jgi:hypothetical protein
MKLEKVASLYGNDFLTKKSRNKFSLLPYFMFFHASLETLTTM